MLTKNQNSWEMKNHSTYCLDFWKCWPFFPTMLWWIFSSIKARLHCSGSLALLRATNEHAAPPPLRPSRLSRYQESVCVCVLAFVTDELLLSFQHFCLFGSFFRKCVCLLGLFDDFLVTFWKSNLATFKSRGNRSSLTTRRRRTLGGGRRLRWGWGLWGQRRLRFEATAGAFAAATTASSRVPLPNIKGKISCEKLM